MNDSNPVVAAKTGRTKESWLTRLRMQAYPIGLGVALAIAAFAAVTTEGFLTVDNLKAVLFTGSFIGIAAVGTTVIMLSGNIFSLSLGTSISVAAMAFLASLEYGLGAAIFMTLLLGTVIFAAQGLVVGVWDANPIIVTIAAGAIQTGLVTWLSSGTQVTPSGTAYEKLGGELFGFPVGFYVLLVLTVVSALVLERTSFGHMVYLMGESRRAARAAGLRVAWITMGAFALAGVAAATAGILLGAFNGTATLSIGGSYTYDAIAAALVGGTAIQGGRGSVWRGFFGAFFIAGLTDLLLLRGYSRGVQILVEGIVVVVVVVLTQVGRRST
jgi:ribose/xylose/arabinose/galactoside ABC-type transport system permease subunit